jgi:flagellar motor switch protein FliM
VNGKNIMAKIQIKDIKTASIDMSDLDDGNVVNQIINTASMRYNRLPVVEVIFERFALLLAPALKIYTASAADVVLKSFDYMSCGEALDGLPSPSFVALVQVEPGGGQIGLVLDSELLFSNVEIMLGGGKVQPGRRDSRSFTMIERRLGTRLVEVIFNELAESASSFTEVRFIVESVESNPRNAMLAPHATPCMRISYDVMLGDRMGAMTFIIPMTSIEEIPALTSSTLLTGKYGSDKASQEAMAETLKEADVDLSAVLCTLRLPMSRILNLQKGMIIPLDIEPEQDAVVHCSNQSMFHASIGRKRNDAIAVKVTSEVVSAENEEMRQFRVLMGGSE